MNIPLFDPTAELSELREEIDQAIAGVLDHGRFILGPEVEQFESRAADYLGVKHAVGVNSGTDALVIALESLGIGEGDEVITTSMSFFATAESISQVGAKPVFLDMHPETFNLDVSRLEELITDRTRAIMPVHLFGLPAPMAEIKAVAEAYSLHVIEDCAQSFGAAYAADCPQCEEGSCDPSVKEELVGWQTGSMGDAGCFSFFPTKNLGGIGDGGLLVTDRDEVAEKARMLRAHGGKDKYQNEMLGYNSRLDTIQAAVLDVKLDYIDEFNERRRKAARYYNDRLGDLDQIITPTMSDGHVYHQYTIRVGNGGRDRLKQFLSERDISTNIYYQVPQNELPVYEGHGYPVLENARKMSDEVLSLPMGPGITREELEKVTEGIRTFFEE